MKTLKDLELFDAERTRDVPVGDFSFRERQRSCRTVSVDELLVLARKWLKKCEKMMKVYDKDSEREMYLFWAGRRSVLMDFFNLEDLDE